MPPKENEVKTPNLAEIDKALKEFEMQSQAGVAPKISEIPTPTPKSTQPIPPPIPQTQPISEIDKALKEFEEKSQNELTTKPAGVLEVAPGTPKMVKWVIKLSGGSIKKQKTAEYVLLILAIFMFGLSFYFFFGFE